MSLEIITKLGLDNYYGGVSVVERECGYYMRLGCHSSVKEIKISKEAYEALLEKPEQIGTVCGVPVFS